MFKLQFTKLLHPCIQRAMRLRCKMRLRCTPPPCCVNTWKQLQASDSIAFRHCVSFLLYSYVKAASSQGHTQPAAANASAHNEETMNPSRQNDHAVASVKLSLRVELSKHFTDSRCKSNCFSVLFPRFTMQTCHCVCQVPYSPHVGVGGRRVRNLNNIITLNSFTFLID